MDEDEEKQDEEKQDELLGNQRGKRRTGVKTATPRQRRKGGTPRQSSTMTTPRQSLGPGGLPVASVYPLTKEHRARVREVTQRRRRLKWLQAVVKSAKIIREEKLKDDVDKKKNNEDVVFIDLSNLQTVEMRDAETEEAERRREQEEHEEEEALLRWSSRLDFEEYVRNWGTIGTSLDSAGNEVV